MKASILHTFGTLDALAITLKIQVPSEGTSFLVVRNDFAYIFFVYYKSLVFAFCKLTV